MRWCSAPERTWCLPTWLSSEWALTLPSAEASILLKQPLDGLWVWQSYNFVGIGRTKRPRGRGRSVGQPDGCSGRQRKAGKWWKSGVGKGLWSSLSLELAADVSTQTSSDAIQEQPFSWMWCLEEIFLLLHETKTLWGMFSCAVPGSTVTAPSLSISRKGPHLLG